MNFPFSWPKNQVVPRDAREVVTPFKGSNEKVVSDVIPTITITEAYPIIGTSTFNDLIYVPSPRADGAATDEFGTYVLRRMRPDSRPGWTRCFFSRTIATDPLPAVSRAESAQLDHLWYSILLRVDLIPDYSFPIVTRGPGGREIFAPRYFPRIFHIPEATEGTLAIDQFYVGSSPFVVVQKDVPQPSDVTFSILGVEGRWPRSLHPRLVFDRKQTAFIAYNTGSGVPEGASGSIAGQVYPETNHEFWVPYVNEQEQNDYEGSLYELRVRTLIPPIPSDVAVATA